MSIIEEIEKACQAFEKGNYYVQFNNLNTRIRSFVKNGDITTTYPHFDSKGNIIGILVEVLEMNSKNEYVSIDKFTLSREKVHNGINTLKKIINY